MKEKNNKIEDQNKINGWKRIKEKKQKTEIKRMYYRNEQRASTNMKIKNNKIEIQDEKKRTK